MILHLTQANGLTFIKWQFRGLLKIYTRITALTIIKQQLANQLEVFKLKKSTLFRKFIPIDIVNIYANIKTIKYFYFFKNRLMIIQPKITYFILISDLCYALAVIFWKSRYVISFTPKYYFILVILYKCSSLKPYTFLISYLSLFFRKFYLRTIPYLTFANTIIEKKILRFTFYKERSYIEYQINTGHYFGKKYKIINHILHHFKKILHLIASVKIDILMFLKDKIVPRRFQLSFYRINTITAYDDLLKCFRFANKKYNSILIDEHYNEKCTLTHLSARLYFKVIPTNMNLLSIQPFSFYNIINENTNLDLQNINDNIQERQKLPVPIITNNTLNSDGYEKNDIDFYTYNNENQ